MQKQVETLSGEIRTENSGYVGNNAKAEGNIIGRDDNRKFVNIFGGHFQKYQKSDIFEVVKTIDKKAKVYYKTENIRLENPDWDEKINYNELNKWKEYFKGCELRLNNFENKILTKLTSSDKLLNYLNQIWIDVSSNPCSGDEKCQLIYDFLLNIVNEGKVQHIGVESIKEGIIITTYWAFTRCQILKNPPENVEVSAL